MKWWARFALPTLPQTLNRKDITLNSQTIILYWLILLRIPGIGAATLRQALTFFGTIDKIFNASFQELRLAGFSSKQITLLRKPNQSLAEADFIWAEKNNCHLISLEDARYPLLLKELPDAPILLFVQGEVSLLKSPQIALVGTRHPTANGRQMAAEFAFFLAEKGLTITSGLALGIDAESHIGALAAGKTIAVCGTGLDLVYPSAHHKLAEEIKLKGALVSEFPPGEKPKAKNFPQRNRIISGLSLGTLVIEAAIRSGSLITARFAVEQGREVFAIPGSIQNPLAHGCHALIRQGAKLVETTEDILEELSILHEAFLPNNGILYKLPPADLGADAQKILACIGSVATTLDAIIINSGLTPSKVSSMLLSLELLGLITAVTGGFIRVTLN